MTAICNLKNEAINLLMEYKTIDNVSMGLENKVCKLSVTNQNQDLTGQKKRLIIDNKKWVFTVHLVTACSFLFLLPEHHTDISCHFRHG